jgi:5-carboxymethyl-2-hydroxymuconate isomerase
MPHVVVEYSANLDSSIDIHKLVRDIHEAVLGSGVFEMGAVRTRAERRDTFIVADGDPENGFVHVELRIAPGRDGPTRKDVARRVLDTLAAATREVFARTGLGLSVEVREIDYTAALRLNNLHERLAAKGKAHRTAT